ncbi:TIGR01777 family oxidoreductase [Corynebacterium sp. CNCTC7651]|uniref:TIGR01777 family oxidoreductase n=1 Tax=Corynebacterium sp. CNCTC7651 TaxID=2815361 RepID=UPI001F2DF8DB|nr:TIGR01777 family oxidoreductase [Corynebacterium sp. CNCTC7651]UIZ93238.1 TIGR01777 family oxidoreductase [Corynebacterium sp. CNCTC7651]
MGLHTSHIVPADRGTVWEWHSRPGAVVRLTPPFLPMQPVEQAQSLRGGTTVFSLPGGLTWVAQHQVDGYVAGEQFVDEAVNQPIKAATQWRHTHHFEDAATADGDPATRVTDTVEANVPEFALRSAWAYRQHQLVEDITFLQSLPETKPLVIALTGASGLVGTHLKAQLTTAGHTVIGLTRGEAGPGERHWDPDNPADDLLEGVDAVAHIAGESIMGRWTEAKKRKIRDSRVGPTRKLAEVAAGCGVSTFVSASAVGYYGTNAGDREYVEEDGPGEGFLAEVCRDWEAASQVEGLRVVNIRTGLALSGAGGLLPVLKASVSAGLGARFGDGDFWMSWVALDDLTDIYTRALVDPSVRGPINATAPNPVTNKEMSATLADMLRRPDVLPIPKFGPKLILGKEGGEELALADQRVVPARAQAAGWRFRYPTLKAALAHELGKEELL